MNKHLFIDENFISHSGLKLDWKIDCDALTELDIQCLARLIAQRVGTFSAVYGIPTGGERLAKALKQYAIESAPAPILVVDDVLTTGKSMAKARKALPISTGFVIFARGELPQDVQALFITIKNNG